jgi:hypothetical protein
MRVLAEHEVDLVVLVGFMRILGERFVQRYAWRIINVHPSLLPDFGGLMDLAVHEAVIKAGKPVTGCTVHFVDAGVDTGAVLWQSSCRVDPGDTPATLKAKVQALEGQVRAGYTGGTPNRGAAGGNVRVPHPARSATRLTATRTARSLPHPLHPGSTPVAGASV